MTRPSTSRRAATVDEFLVRLTGDPDRRRRIAHLHADPARAVDDVPLPEGLPPALVEALRADGKERLWHHQREALDHALAGRNVVLATETSSGKSLCFQVPVVASLLTNPNARALFLYPTNPLANDQELALKRLLERLPPDVRPRAPARLQGGMGNKDALSASDPPVVLTNPEMVHLHLLPRHRQWENLWRGLEWIVVDEIHLYRGAFGGHLANLLRRIRRTAWRYGAKPRVLAASATVGNPKALAEELCSTPFELVDRTTSPRGQRTTVLWKPDEDDDYADEALDLFARALEAGLQAILFARSRQMVEQLVSQLEEKTGRTRIGLGVRAYRAGYLKEEREIIERGLRDGSVRGVVTTNALEVGIDIGSLDVCIIAGWPGSVMALRQQAGRVGRRDRASAVFLVASENPLDAWYLRHPQALSERGSEDAVLGRLNPHVLRSHLACAASEFPLWEAEIERFGGEVAKRAASELIERNEARWGVEGPRRVLLARAPRSVSLRSASQERFSLVDPDGEVVGDIDGSAVAREAFPGAVYLHQGRTFRVDRVETGRVHLRRGQPGASTRVQGERSIFIVDTLQTRALAGGVEAIHARVRVLDRYTTYLESTGRGRKAYPRPLDPPIESELVTEALVLRLSDSARRAVAEADAELAEALHATEHLFTSLASTLVLCDRDDVEGHAPCTPELAAAVLFDRHPGGLGFASAAFARIDEMVTRAGEVADECACADGCPECVQTSRCLRGNDELSKNGARRLLGLARGLTVPARRAAAAPTVLRRPKKERVSKVDAFEPAPRTPQTDSDRPFEPKFAAGDRVEHVVHGEGRVVEVRPTGRVVVDFGSGGVRRISAGWLRPAR